MAGLTGGTGGRGFRMSSDVRTPWDVGDFPSVGSAKTMRIQLSRISRNVFL